MVPPMGEIFARYTYTADSVGSAVHILNRALDAVQPAAESVWGVLHHMPLQCDDATL